jgi:Flp pilus assembly pilin Flp
LRRYSASAGIINANEQLATRFLIYLHVGAFKVFKQFFGFFKKLEGVVLIEYALIAGVAIITILAGLSFLSKVFISVGSAITEFGKFIEQLISNLLGNR